MPQIARQTAIQVCILADFILTKPSLQFLSLYISNICHHVVCYLYLELGAAFFICIDAQIILFIAIFLFYGAVRASNLYFFLRGNLIRQKRDAAHIFRSVVCVGVSV